jgi:hypothetical protein
VFEGGQLIQYGNTASGDYSVVPGGRANTAAGVDSFAAGRRAKANHTGVFVWGDSTVADVASSAANTFNVRASGGIWLGTNSSPSIGNGRFIDTSTGAYLTTGGTWTNSSDRLRKENVRDIDAHRVLEQVVQLSITTWNYKAEGTSIRHLGPMAQDFHAAFGLGDSETAISTIDADGVALTSIQALYQLVREKEERIVALEGRIAEIEQRVSKR